MSPERRRDEWHVLCSSDSRALDQSNELSKSLLAQRTPGIANAPVLNAITTSLLSMRIVLKNHLCLEPNVWIDRCELFLYDSKKPPRL